MHQDQLNAQHGIDQQLVFITGEGGIPLINIKNSQAKASISLQGAQVLSWAPKTATGEFEEVIWVSDKASFLPGKSVRGGIPICWPWFGPHSTRKNFPAHGFARTTRWQIESTLTLDDGSSRICLTMEPRPENVEMWPSQTSVLVQITIGKKLEIELITHNHGTETITIGQAFHTYFKVGDISQVILHGLADTDYLDKLDDFKRKHQHGPIVIDKEVDRIYLDTTTDCVLEDKHLKRNIIIIKCGSHSTVVWNPWEETARRMGDLGEQGYKKMLCVESSNAAEDVVTIEPGKDHHLWVQYARD